MKILINEFFKTLSLQIKQQKIALIVYGIFILLYSCLLFFTKGILISLIFMLITILLIFIVMFVAYIILEFPDRVLFKKSLVICEDINKYFVKLDKNTNMKSNDIEKYYNDFITQKFPSRKVLLTWKYYLDRNLFMYVLIIPVIAVGLKYFFGFLYENVEGLLILLSDGELILSSLLNEILSQSGLQLSESGIKFFYYIYLLAGYYSHIERINVTIKQIEFMLDTQ